MLSQRKPPARASFLARATKVKAYAADAMPYQDVRRGHGPKLRKVKKNIVR